MGNTAKGLGIGIANGVGLGAIIPDPLSDAKGALTEAKNDFQYLCDSSNLIVLQKYLSTTQVLASNLNNQIKSQASSQALTDEFLAEDIQMNSLTIIILYFLVVMIFVFGFVLT